MSVIAGKVYNDKIIIAGDSQITIGCHVKDNSQDFVKLKEINNMIIGCVGSCNEASLLYYFMETHMPATSKERDIHNFFMEFIEYKNKFLKENDLNKDTYLLIFNKHLFKISQNCLITEIKDFTAIGCGKDFALAALHLGHSPKEAVKVACELDCFVAEPIIEYVINK